MTVAELIEMILAERIAAILSQTSSQKDVLEKGEMVLNELPEEQRSVIKDYLDHFIEQEGKNNEQAYLSGFEDAICLVGKLGIILIHSLK